MPAEQTWERWLTRLYNLGRDTSGCHERPHKAVLLLSVLDLFDRGILCHNKVPFSPELLKTFQRYFDPVAREDDLPLIEDPFYHLAGDGFWQVLDKSGDRPIYNAGSSRAPVARILRECYGKFEDDLWSDIITYATSRRQLREALISRYFPEHRAKMDALAGKQTTPSPALYEEPPGREGAFRRTVLEIYDHRCSACGIRVKYSEEISLVQAAHLVPFHLSRNDRPNNGVALCPNHYWAMDHGLIAPCPDSQHEAGVWRVREDLAIDLRDHEKLMAIANNPVMAPNEEKFLPALEGLKWREQQLGGHR